MTELKRRTIAKTITFRLIATIVTYIIVYVMTGDIALANAIGFLDLVTKLITYYIHERIWEQVGWGKSTSSKISSNQRVAEKARVM